MGCQFTVQRPVRIGVCLSAPGLDKNSRLKTPDKINDKSFTASMQL
jgi:hypothetical protein